MMTYTTSSNRHPEPREAGPVDGMNVISAYTREQALADGVLVDVSAIAKRAGALLPVAFTAALWAALGETEHKDGRDFEAFALCACIGAAAQQQGGALGARDTLELRLKVPFVGKASKSVTLWVMASYEGENGTPVLTVMFPEDY
jgi:hypothetical protein